MCLTNYLKSLFDELIICLHIVHEEKNKSKGIQKNYYLQGILPLTQHITATCNTNSLEKRKNIQKCGNSQQDSAAPKVSRYFRENIFCTYAV